MASRKTSNQQRKRPECHTPDLTITRGTPSKAVTHYWGGDVPWASVKDLNINLYIEKTLDTITQEGLIQGSKLAEVSDLLICTRMGLGKIAIVKKEMAFNQDLKAIKLSSYIDPIFFINCFKTKNIIGSGMTVAGIRQDELLDFTLSFPPLEEQQRIVAKVDELMQLCDQLEEQQNLSSETHATLVVTLLKALTESNDAEEFQANWQLIVANFDLLFTTDDSLEQLKQSILQLAVMGKLVKQDPEDESASKLLKQIAAEKEQLLQGGLIKKSKPLPEISEEEKPFALADGWEWKRLGDVIHIKSGNGLIAANMAKNGSYPVYGGNGINGYHDKFNVSRKTLVIGRVGYYCGSVHISEEKAWITDNAFITDFSEKLFGLNYLALLLGITNLKENESATAQPVISGRKIYPIVVAIPPLNEQKRIVDKVNQLLTLIEQLQSLQTQLQQAKRHLADALVANTQC